MRIKFLYIIGLLITSCNHYRGNTFKLHYDLYKADTLAMKNAITIEYKQSGSFFRAVKVSSSIDSLQLLFNERLTDSAIYRSIDRSDYILTHSFTIGKKIESNLPKTHPVFLNTLIRAIGEKNYKYKNADSIAIIFFDEAIPRYIFTSSYYSKQVGFFLIYYNQMSDEYFKLSKIEGLSSNFNKNEILEIVDKLSHDTLFFGKHYRPPAVEPPPLKE
jgi:hypothetical protein